MKSIILASISLVFILICSEVTTACWCRREVFDTEKKFRAAVAVQLRGSTIVFAGEPIERNRAGLRFKVEKVWKGTFANEIILTSKNYVVQGNCTEQDPCFFTSCVYPFEMGKKYLVYAYIEDGLLNVNLCSRTEALEKAGRDVNELDRIESNKNRRVKVTSSPKSNNGMHPTANRAVLIRETPCLLCCVRGG